MEEKKRNNDIVKKSLLVICGVVLLFAITYALFNFNGYGEKEQRLSTGTLVLTLNYSFMKDSSSKIDLLSTNSGLLDTGMLAPGESKSYTLRLWISDTATNDVMGTHFHGKIQVKAIQEGHTDYDTGE